MVLLVVMTSEMVLCDGQYEPWKFTAGAADVGACGVEENLMMTRGMVVVPRAASDCICREREREREIDNDCWFVQKFSCTRCLTLCDFF